jgi:hypothetical protein
MSAIRISQNELKRVAVHESGHAIMAVIQGIPCRGIFFAYEPSEVGIDGEITGGRFCTPVGNNPPWKKGDYLQSAAGSGAERLSFGEYNRDASTDDRKMFSSPAAPDWEATVDEAEVILAKTDKIVQMAEAIILKHQRIPMILWPDRGMGNKSTRFKQILSEEEVHEIAQLADRRSSAFIRGKVLDPQSPRFDRAPSLARDYSTSSSCCHSVGTTFGSSHNCMTRFSSTRRLLGGLARRAKSARAISLSARVRSRRDL